MNKRYFTVEDLIQFCENKKMYNFSSVESESGKPLVVQSIQDFSSADIEETEDNKLFAKVRVCHTLLNRNGSYASEESMKEAMPSLKYAPLLANIHQLDDGSWDFHSHDYHMEEDEDGNEYVVYDEKQVGTFTADDPYLEYDKEMDKTYVVARVAIPENYTKCADILREKKGTKVSCELAVYDCSYNAKEKYLQLDKFEFVGCTCLGSEKDGTPIGEGMLGSKLTLEDFSEENNSLIKFNQKMIELQERLDKLESSCFNNTDDSKKGGDAGNMNKFEELLEKYNKTAEDVTFDYVELSDEELEAKFEEEFGDDAATTDDPEDNSDGENNDDDVAVVEDENGEDNGEGSEEPDGGEGESQTFENMTRTFEISHDDIRYALYNLLGEFEEIDNEWYYITSVFDTYFVYESWDGGKIYGQKYSKDNDNVAFDGDRYVLHKEYITDDELAELNSMRANYTELKEFKENVEKNELHAQREEIVNSEKYSVLAKTDEDGKFVNVDFAKLVSEMDNYSLAELETKIKVMHSDYVSSHATTFAEKEVKPKQKVLYMANSNSEKESKKKAPYGGIFEKYNK